MCFMHRLHFLDLSGDIIFLWFCLLQSQTCKHNVDCISAVKVEGEETMRLFFKRTMNEEFSDSVDIFLRSHIVIGYDKIFLCHYENLPMQYTEIFFSRQ